MVFKVITADSYKNNIIVAVSTIAMYALAGSIINSIGGKTILSTYEYKCYYCNLLIKKHSHFTLFNKIRLDDRILTLSDCQIGFIYISLFLGIF